MDKQHFDKSYGGKPPVNYERYFVPVIGEPLAIDLIQVAALGDDDRVLDVACGTGVVARLAAQQVGGSGSVAGLDPNPGMLAVAKSSAPPDASIEWHQAGAEDMPFQDGAFDVVLCQMGLQFVSDKDAALREMRRVLTSEGRLFLNLPGPTPRIFRIMSEALARNVGKQAAGFVEHVFSLYDPSEIESLLDIAGFNDVSVQSETKSLPLPAPSDFLWQYISSTPLAGAMSEVSDEKRKSLEQDVVAEWERLMDDQALILQVPVVTATGRA